MTDVISSPWLAYAVLAIVTAGCRLRCGNWFAPAAFVGLIWSFFSGMSLLVVDYPPPARGVWMLVLLIVAIQLGALAAHEIQPELRPSDTSDLTVSLDSLIAPCRRYSVFCAAIALTGCVYFLVTSLREFDLPFNFLSVLEVGARWTVLRYDDAVEPWSVRLMVMWLHPAGLLGGILFACAHTRRDRIIGIAVLLPSIFYAVLTGARAAILLGLTCWIGGFVASSCLRNRRLAWFSMKRLPLWLLAGASAVGMFGAIDAVRDSRWSDTVVFALQEQKLINYIFGSPAAFAQWYAHSDVSGAEWGARTFAGEFDLLHLKTRTLGTYSDKSNVVGTESTNVYTLFRGLIEDFTPIGALVLAPCVGGLAGWSYRTRFRRIYGPLFWLSMFYSYFLFSPLMSLFSFNGALLAWVVAWFVVRNPQPRKLALGTPRFHAGEAPAL